MVFCISALLDPVFIRRKYRVCSAYSQQAVHCSLVSIKATPVFLSKVIIQVFFLFFIAGIDNLTDWDENAETGYTQKTLFKESFLCLSSNIDTGVDGKFQLYDLFQAR